MNTKVKVTVIAALIAITAMALTPTTTGYKVKPIKIGVIAATQEGYEDYLPLFKEILEPDINQYVSTLPKLRFNPTREFQFIMEHADSSPAIHLEKVQALHAMGVDLIIGGFWSSQAAASLNYVNENGILLLSGSSTSQSLSIPGDNLYRLCPDDDIQAKPLARMMYSKGTRNAIVIARDNHWGQSLSSAFQDRFEDLGGDILGTFYYPRDETDFAPYLEEADRLADGKPDVSVLLLSFNELADIIIQARDYTTIYNSAPWYTSEFGGRNAHVLDEAPDQAIHLTLYSPQPTPPDTAKYRDLAERYEALTGKTPHWYTTTAADAAWIIAQAVLETRPTFTPGNYDEAQAVIDALPHVTYRHQGYSGWTLLNEAGDRAEAYFEIWGYCYDNGSPSYALYGNYDTATDELNWHP